MQLNDTDLIIQAQKGNQNAFEELVYRYDRNVLSIALKYSNNEDDAKDLYQEVFIRVYRGIKNFRFQSEFSTWLFRITTNVCLTYKSRSKEHLKVSIDKDFDDEEHEFNTTKELVYDGSTPEEISSGANLGEIVNAAVESLSPKQRMTFVLKHYEGYKIREIAEMLNCKEGTVKKYLFDATKNLRKKLSPVYA
ncbi:MAG: sigma-70 family RNA polymerase sigma factor [Ignavibacteriaceae bacterium]|jgi:RNA polymerase sigma-70 factor (ECF subfamily)|nr:sigma-70 family RNA polymerase sigma factor [Ignavibacteriaceae bacterium]MCU0413120.1 sigma-70 family RNA polymerase sigma factor [Ignavibacteriaceae bacterium]